MLNLKKLNMLFSFCQIMQGSILYSKKHMLSTILDIPLKKNNNLKWLLAENLCSENLNWNSFIVVVYVCVCFASEGKLRFFCALRSLSSEIPVSYQIKPAYWRYSFIQSIKTCWKYCFKKIWRIKIVFLCESFYNKHETQQGWCNLKWNDICVAHYLSS